MAVAPMAPTLVRKKVVKPKTISEKQNYQQLKWNESYNEYYGREWKDETRKYLSDKINSFDASTNYKWYKYINPNINDMTSLRGHTLSDIGNDSMLTIGDHRKQEKISIYKINKHFSTFEKLVSNGPSPRGRFSHSAQYIPMFNSILFFAGFDAHHNYNDARLLRLDTMIWHDLQYNQRIHHRAHHSYASRLITNTKDKINKFECYIFGGMWCNGGPYEFHNDIFKFTFYDTNYQQIATDENKQNEAEKFGYFTCEKLVIKCYNTPSKRSQCNSWIKGDTFYVFGGTIATQTVNDLWALDLKTNVWTQIQYDGIIKAPQTIKIKPKNYKVGARRKPCYFDQDRNELIVIHYGTLSDIQKRFVEFDGTFEQFKKSEAQKNSKNEINEDVKCDEMETMKKLKMLAFKQKGIIGMLQDTMKCTIFVFDLTDRIWYIKRNRNVNDDDKLNVPSKLIGSTRMVRIGEYLIQIGGGFRGSRSNVSYMKNLYMLKIPTSVWNRERLIWIGHYKENSKKHDVCVLNKCAKDVIHLILSFLR